MALARLVSASQAADYYYEKDPVCAPDGKGENSEWYGDNLIKNFGLNRSHVDAKHFTSLLYGQNPQDGKELVSVGVNEERRAGFDLAFSAPKSVSIAALHLKDENVIQAHKIAVDKALSFIENNFIQYREKRNGEMYYVQTDNMIAAKFTHSTTRANDPQLHTHTVIANIVKTYDNSYKAISNELIMRHQKLINNIYQNELAINLQQIGYSIENYKNKFEIKGISEETREIFSKRSKEIESCYESIKNKYPELSEEELRDIAVLQSRNDKNVTVTKEELEKLWEKEAPKENIKPEMNIVKQSQPKDLFTLAITDIQTTEATFSKMQLLNSMLEISRGESRLDELIDIIESNIKDKKILQMGEHKGQLHYATPEMIQTEHEITASIEAGINTKKQIMEEQRIKLPDNLTDGQRDFVKTVLTTKDLVTIVQGDAGTGKTYAVKQVRELIEKEKSDVSIVGLGFTGKAARELAEAAGIETSTIASFLLSGERQTNSIILIDEASMVSSKDMKQIIEKASEGDNKIVLIGDRKQLQAIGAGKMFSELQDEKIVQPVQMSEVLRQKTAVTKELVKNIADYQDKRDLLGIKHAFKLMEDNKIIAEYSSKSKNEDVTKLYIQRRAIEEYLSNDDSIILTASRKEKDSINSRVRSLILTEENLSLSKSLKIKESLGTSYFASEYRAGDKVNIKNKEYTVIGSDISNNTLELEYRYKNSNRSTRLRVNPFDEQIVASREKDKSFTIGDKIIFTKNDKRLGVQNGLSGVIENIDKQNNITVALKEGKKVIFNIEDYSHIDYGYALTLHKAQGQTCQKAILVHSVDDNISTESFYVAATRATHEFIVITPDKKILEQKVTKAQDKTSTREFVVEGIDAK